MTARHARDEEECDDGTCGIDMSKWDGRRHFVAYWHFVGWSCISLGLHVSTYEPNVEVHLPFGFIRIGWNKCPLLTPEDYD